MVTTTNLISYYNFDEASGDLIDQVAAYDGTNTGVGYSQTGVIDTCYYYDGGTDNTDCNHQFITGTQDFSISFWSKSAGNQTTYATHLYHNSLVIPCGIVFMQDYPTNNVLNFMWGDFSTWHGLSYNYNPDTDTNWHHLAVTKNGSTIIIYLDGSEVTRDESATIVYDATEELAIATSLSNANREFNGYIDELGIWVGTVLTPSEISALYNGGAGLAYPFPQGINTQVNIGDVWKDVSTVQINIGDVWKTASSAQINVGDVWKTIF